MSDVRVRIVGDNSGLTGALTSADNSIVGWANKIGGVLKGLAGLVVGGALGGFFKKAVEEAIEGERGIEALRRTVDNAGASFQAWQPRIEGVIERLSRTTRATDDELRAALGRLIVVSNDVSGSLRNLSLVTDVAAAKNISLEEAASVVGKAMAGNVKALREYGIDIKNTANPIEELRGKVLGLAQAQMTGLGGALEMIRKQFGEVLEAIGGVITGHDDLTGSGHRLADALADLAKWIESNEEQIRGWGSGVASVMGGIFAVLKGAGDGIRLLGSIWFTVLSAMESVAADFIGAAGAVFKAIGIDAVASHAAKLRSLAERHMDEAKALGAKALGQTREQAENSVLAWERAQTTILTNEQFYGAQRTSVATAESEKRRKVAEKEEESHRKIMEKMSAESEKHLRKTGDNLSKLITAQYREAADAAEQLRLALTGALGDTTRAMLLRSGDAIERILNTLRTRIPLADYERLKALADEYRTSLRETLPPAEALAASVKQLQEDEKKLAGTAEEVRRKFQEKIEKARLLAEGFLGMASALGLVDDKAANILHSVISIATSLPKALGGDAGSIVAVLGGLANVIAGLGNSELQKRIREVTSKNTAAVEALTRSIGDLALNLPGNRFQAVQEALQAAQKAGELKPGEMPKEAANRARETLLRELAKRGVTRAEAEEVLKTLGIEGVFDKQTLVGLHAIQKALEALGQAQIGKIGDDFQAQFRALMDAFEIFKIEDADDKIAELKKLFTRFSPALAEAFKGVDLGSQEGLKELQNRLQALFQKMLTGEGLTPTELGELTGGQTIDAIKQLLGLLGGADTVRSFLTPLIGAGGKVPTGGTLDVHTRLPLPLVDEALAGMPRGPVTNIAGGVNVTFQINGARDASEIADEMAERLSVIFGQRYERILAAQGSGVAAL